MASHYFLARIDETRAVSPNVSIAATIDTVLAAWKETMSRVLTTPADFLGRDKETKVLRCLRSALESTAPSLVLSGPDLQEKFGTWSIDLVCGADSCRLAIEGKFKTVRDGATPDKR